MRHPLAALLCLVATSAIADWAYDPAPVPSGRASGTGTSGLSFWVDCGPGGVPGVGISGHNPGAAEEIFVIRIDGHAEELWFASCQGADCALDLESFERASVFFDQISTGSEVQISLYRRGGLDRISLLGAAPAIGKVTGRDCPMPRP